VPLPLARCAPNRQARRAADPHPVEPRIDLRVANLKPRLAEHGPRSADKEHDPLLASSAARWPRQPKNRARPSRRPHEASARPAGSDGPTTEVACGPCRGASTSLQETSWASASRATVKIQAALNLVLEPIFEADSPSPYGFIPKRGQSQPAHRRALRCPCRRCSRGERSGFRRRGS